MELVATLTFEQARACVISKATGSKPAPRVEETLLEQSAGRVLAESVQADRDYPPTARSVRDGFAVHAADLPGTLRVIGEVRAGESYSGTVANQEAVEIMTGAPMPHGADSVVMVEHTSSSDNVVKVDRTLARGENVNPQGSEAHKGDEVLRTGALIGFAEIAMLATVGNSSVRVFAKPRVAILATGDEILNVQEVPLPHQIRNSNSHALAVQVARAGGCPEILPVARDEYQATRALIERGLAADLLLLSGGVSAGKYDLVEKVLADLGAEFFFDRVLIQPGQPLVFGSARGKLFFGLPGNPASTMVTFEIFARAAVELLGGRNEVDLPLLWARLSRDFRQKTGLTRFLPAKVNGSQVTPIGWQGSGDVAALARSNAFLVTEPDRESWREGELIQVLMK